MPPPATGSRPRPFESVDAFLPAVAATGPLLGIDIGARTIGVASSDSERRIALPVETIHVARPVHGRERLRVIAGERGAVGVVAGLPVRLDGRGGSSAQGVRRVAEGIQDALGLPLLLWDERLSTAAVERAMVAADISRARRRRGVDAEAAAWILQGALDAMRAA